MRLDDPTTSWTLGQPCWLVIMNVYSPGENFQGQAENSYATTNSNVGTKSRPPPKYFFVVTKKFTFASFSKNIRYTGGRGVPLQLFQAYKLLEGNKQACKRKFCSFFFPPTFPVFYFLFIFSLSACNAATRRTPQVNLPAFMKPHSFLKNIRQNVRCVKVGINPWFCINVTNHTSRHISSCSFPIWINWIRKEE